MVLMALTDWRDCREKQGVTYVIEENHLLRRQLGGRRVRLTVDDHGRLATRRNEWVGRSCPSHRDQLPALNAAEHPVYPPRDQFRLEGSPRPPRGALSTIAFCRRWRRWWRRRQCATG